MAELEIRPDKELEDLKKGGNKDERKLSPEELQAKIAHMQAILDKQQQKRAEQIAKHSGQPGNISAMIKKNTDKQLAKTQARIDALKAQLAAAQTGSTTGSGISAGQTATTSVTPASGAPASFGAITVKTASSRVLSGDEDSDKAKTKARSNDDGKGPGKIR